MKTTLGWRARTMGFAKRLMNDSELSFNEQKQLQRAYKIIEAEAEALKKRPCLWEQNSAKR